ncbi:MAG: hypothetical protein JSV79_13445 [Armatimonadota bacterium]|nr:MAG: hypothetical protein JSV79_13445 [Armatimonadota bacterium]
MSDLEEYLQQLRDALDVTAARADVIVGETRCHLEAKAAELQQAGESRQDAVQTAMREFGDPKTMARALTHANARHRTYRRLLKAVLALCGLVLAAGAVIYGLYGFKTKLTKGGVGIAARPPAETTSPRPLTSLPRYDPTSFNAFQVRLEGQDLREFDVSDRLPDLLQANFDTRTQWPEELPEGFEPARFLELGKNPGLGLRALHEQGITGRGVSIAIIDHRLLVEHAEFSDRLRLYEELHSFEPKASMHGTAVASIAVGKTVGVAPEADLYYISSFWMTSNPLPWARLLSRVVLFQLKSSRGEAPAEPQMGSEMVDFVWAARAIERVLDLNRDLPAARKIRAISIEVGWAPGQPGYEEAMAAVERAKEEGVFVISSCLHDTHGLQFHGLGREPLKDPDDPASFYPISAWGPDPAEPTLLIPMEARTVAAPSAASDYGFHRQGGWSWVAPYLAGLYALACQVNPDVTPELFWETALETGTTPAPSAPRPREEVREQMARRFDTSIAARKQRWGEEEVARLLKVKYEEMTGQPAPQVSEAEFRELWIDAMTDDAILRAAGGEGKIVNPFELMKALEK